MTLGLDIGSSAVKLVGMEGEKLLFAHSELRGGDLYPMIDRVLSENNAYKPSRIAVTGVGAESCGLNMEGVEIVSVPELLAAGEGGCHLADRDNAVVVSLGTGTAIICVRDGVCTHLGGSGVGSGTLRGLSKRLFGVTDVDALYALAEKGDYGKVDLRIIDLFSGSDTLPPDLTASNMAKPNASELDEDWAAAIFNLVLEVAGSHGALAADCLGMDTVIVTGGLAMSKQAADCFGKFDRLYPQHFIIPPRAGYATAIGAARRIFE